MDRVGITTIRDGLLDDAAAVRHLVKVLRLGAGDEFLAYDGAHELRLRIESVSGGSVRVAELARRALEPTADLTVAQCLIKGRRWDVFLEKMSELGVARILPVVSARSVARVDEERHEHRLARWHKIARAAAAQSAGRTPIILDPTPLPAALERLATTAKNRVVVCFSPDAAPLADALFAAAPGQTALLLGPEGDFTPDELDAALSAEFAPAHIGPRILRSETAAVAATVIALGALGALRNKNRSYSGFFTDMACL
jgi:16S rRNA (uracil1498-N3)-methyltransferase